MQVRQRLLAAVMAAVSSVAFAQAQPVVLRFASDLPPPPHPAGLAMKHFADRLPQVIPGSEARLYFAGTLYTAAEAFEAMRQGSLEMTWLQIGKSAPVDPWLMTVVGPGILTTVGAVDSLEKTQTYQMLVQRLEAQHRVKVFGAGHMSFGMGIGGKQRYAKPDDFAGRKVRSMGLVENVSLESWQATPVVMAFGEVPSALESGVIDGLMASVGGWLGVREQAPYYTMGGAGTFVGDYYMVGASLRWWDGLSGAQRAALEGLVKETIKVQKELNWCIDKSIYDTYGTRDPAKPGVYRMSPAEAAAMVAAMGDRPIRYVKSRTPDAADSWIDLFAQEGRELSGKNPPGSSWIEKLDCSKFASRIIGG